MPNVGDRAPDFTGTLADGRSIGLTDILKRHHLVLYFYPRDFTPGCTMEACAFRDHRAEINALGGEIYGVSLDPPDRHAAFAERHGLKFPLITDGDGAIARAYGVLRLGGWLLTKRVTFVIDRGGVIRHIVRSEINMDTHIDQAVAALKRLADERGATK